MRTQFTRGGRTWDPPWGGGDCMMHIVFFQPHARTDAKYWTTHQPSQNINSSTFSVTPLHCAVHRAPEKRPVAIPCQASFPLEYSASQRMILENDSHRKDHEAYPYCVLFSIVACFWVKEALIPKLFAELTVRPCDLCVCASSSS